MKRHKLVGYGSLVNHKSLSKTIPDRRLKPVIIKDYRRIFNLALKKTGRPDVLNIEPRRGKFLNAVLFTISDKELQEIKHREAEYNLEEVEIYDFTTHKKIGTALTVVDHLVAIDHHNKPNKEYFILCREAAYQISNDFGTFWDNTTYTASNKKIKDWIKKNPKYDTIQRK